MEARAKMDHLSHFTDPITTVFRGPILLLVLVVNGIMYGAQNGVRIFAGGWLTPATVQTIEAATQVLSLMVIVGTIIWHLYDYAVDTETDVRQEQIDEALQLIAENQASGTDVEITDEGKMRILYHLKDLDVGELTVAEIKAIIEQVQQNSRQSDGSPDS
ncbi:hypothetical protein [Salinibacter phage M31CR41-2]|uniref:Uncharacterized protein n=1 Tax=Salinibacter phage M31CR41-2 TaxID=2681614 RepID=A0A2I6UH35_9CAUD|nr:hypothetical protein FGG68_gp53 [Salinibacter phage M31CR41-2]AUO79294.1 hypothetical protein [Salinibacter phage M31CR41-2]